MNKFRNVPAIITLLAGFITSVIMIKYRYTLVNFMWILICVMLAKKMYLIWRNLPSKNNCSIWADFVLLSEYILLIGGTDHG